MYYFAYGMNTDPGAMSERLAKASSAPLAIGAAVLPDWQFRFAYYADVQPAKGSQVGGVLWKISAEHLSALDAREGFPYFYDRKIVTVHVNGQTVGAWVYFMQSGEPTAPPAESYLDMLVRGYTAHGVDLYQVHSARADAERISKDELLAESLKLARTGRAYERMCEEDREYERAQAQAKSQKTVTKRSHALTDAEWYSQEQANYMDFNFGKYYN